MSKPDNRSVEYAKKFMEYCQREYQNCTPDREWYWAKEIDKATIMLADAEYREEKRRKAEVDFDPQKLAQSIRNRGYGR